LIGSAFIVLRKKYFIDEEYYENITHGKADASIS
jgi:hypothetical protein